MRSYNEALKIKPGSEGGISNLEYAKAKLEEKRRTGSGDAEAIEDGELGIKNVVFENPLDLSKNNGKMSVGVEFSGIKEGVDLASKDSPIYNTKIGFGIYSGESLLASFRYPIRSINKYTIDLSDLILKGKIKPLGNYRFYVLVVNEKNEKIVDSELLNFRTI